MGTVLATCVNIPQNENRLYDSSQSVNVIEALERSRARLNQRSDSELASCSSFRLRRFRFRFFVRRFSDRNLLQIPSQIAPILEFSS